MNPNSVLPEGEAQRRVQREELPPIMLGSPARPKRLEKLAVPTPSIELQPPSISKMEPPNNYQSDTLEELEKKYSTDFQKGLTLVQAARRLQSDGENRLTVVADTHWSLRLLKEMIEPFSLLLWLAAALSFLTYGLYKEDANLGVGLVLCFIVIVNGFVHFFYSEISKPVVNCFKDFEPFQVLVVRNGDEMYIESTRLVKGDVIRLQTGRKVPADVRVIDSRGLRASAIPGASLNAQHISLHPTSEHNVAYFSTLILQGTGTAVVVETGNKMNVGKLLEADNPAPVLKNNPVDKSVREFVKWLSAAIICVTVILFCVGFAVGYPPYNNLTFAIGMLVAGVPEGLLFEVLMIKVVAARKLRKKNIAINGLGVLERLAGINTIITVKDNCITADKLEVSQLWLNGNNINAEGQQPKEQGDPLDPEEPTFKALRVCSAVSTVAVFDESGGSSAYLHTSIMHAGYSADHLHTNMQPISMSAALDETHMNLPKSGIDYRATRKKLANVPVLGDGTEAALLRFLHPFEDTTKIREGSPVARSKDDSELRTHWQASHKYSFVICNHPTMDSEYCVFTKGAPQRVWNHCTHVLVGGRPTPKVQTWESRFEQTLNNMATRGQRVVAFARLQLPRREFPVGFDFNLEHHNFPFEQQCFVGMVSMRQVIKQKVPYAVARCQDAGIQVIMVANDNKTAATAIARRSHIITGPTLDELYERNEEEEEQQEIGDVDAIVVEGTELDKLIEGEQIPFNQETSKLAKLLAKPEVVIAGARSARQTTVLSVCHAMGRRVAVIGAETMDAPAISKADVGVTLGTYSNHVASKASDLILQDNDFSKLYFAMEQGNRMFDNIKKAIAFALASQWSRMLPYIGLIALQFPLPISIPTLLWISLVMDLVPSIAFAYEQPQASFTSRKYTSKEAHLISGPLIAQSYGYFGFNIAWAAFFAYYTVVNDFGFRPADLNGKASIRVVPHSIFDSYNPSSPYMGNSNLQQHFSTKCPSSNDSNFVRLDWNGISHASQDLRMAALNCTLNAATGLPVYKQLFNWTRCRTYQISPVSNSPVCYSTEAMKYGQSAFVFGLAICQLANLVACKTRRTSIIRHGMQNGHMNMAMLFSVVSWIALAYIVPFNIAFNTRDNIFMHFGMPAIPFALGMLIFDELRKLLAVAFKPSESGKPNWWERMTVW